MSTIMSLATRVFSVMNGMACGMNAIISLAIVMVRRDVWIA